MDWLNLPVREALVLTTVIVGLWTGKRLLPWLVREITGAVIDEVGDRLESRWEASIAAALGPINVTLDELRPDGGASVKDQVSAIRRSVDELTRAVETLHTNPPRYQSPLGTPDGF